MMQRRWVLRIVFSSIWFTLSKGTVASDCCLLLTLDFVLHCRAGEDLKPLEVGER